MAEKKNLPDGLEEMAKDEDGMDRAELDRVFEELYEEIQQTSISRRKLLGVFGGGGGLAVLNALAAQKKYNGDSFEAALAAIEDAGEGDLPPGVHRVEEPPYQVGEDYERFDNRNSAFRTTPTGPWIESEGGEAVRNPEGHMKMFDEALAAAKPIFGLEPDEIEVSSPVVSRSLKALQDSGRHGVRAPLEPLMERPIPDDHVPGYMGERPPDSEDPVLYATMAKQVARIWGSGDTGITKLDKRWIYSHDPMPIRFRDVDKPEKTDEEFTIPNDMDNVVVGLCEMPLDMTRSERGFNSSGGSMHGYARDNIVAVGVATWIKEMGYEAIPSRNSTGLNVPLAIDAGLGQYGRHGRLIHPQFGSNVRPWKVITDMPLAEDSWIDFGATEFCKGCKICAAECPSQSIPYGEQTWEPDHAAPSNWEELAPDVGYNDPHAPGKRVWYTDPRSCVRLWSELGSSCVACMVNCPFTQGRSWLHDVIRTLAGRSRGTDQALASMSESFGYHGRVSSEAIWDSDLLPYGIEQDPGLGGF